MAFWDVIKQIWTIMRHSIVQATRMKVALIIAIFLMVLVPSLPFLLKSDQTHIGQIRLIVTYSFYLIGFLLSVLTLFLSVAALNSEIKGQQIFLLDPKPVPRYALLLGKWGGVMLINLALLVGMLGVTYGLVRYHGRKRPDETKQDYDSVKSRLLTARATKRPPLPEDLRQKVEEAIEKAQKEHMMPEDKSVEWVRARLLEQYSQSAWYVKPGQSIKWTISGIPKFEGWLTIKFQFFGDADLGMYDHLLPCEFVVNEDGQPVVRMPPEDGTGLAYLVGKKSSFAVRSTVVQDDGTVTIRFTNLDPKVGAMFPLQGGIQVMYPTASLLENFARGGAVIFMCLSMIAVFGVFFSTFLSFPVGVLASVVVFFVGTIRNIIVTQMLPDLFVFGQSVLQPGSHVHSGDVLLREVIMRIVSLFPNFGGYDIVPLLADGLVVDVMGIVAIFIDFVVIRGGILALAGWYIYRRRELAALTPQT